MSGTHTGRRRPGAGQRRLLLVIDSPDGGLGAVASRHRGWFQDAGWHVDVVGPEPGPDAQVVPSRAIGVPHTTRDAAGLVAAARALRGIVRRDLPDVVHCHGPRALVVARLAGIRRPFVTIHGTGAVESDPPGYHHVRVRAVALLPRFAQTAFTAAPELPSPWRFLPHASPRLGSMRQSPVPTEGPPTFLWLARLDEGRSPGTFVRAIAEVARRRAVRGIVAGTGPDGRRFEQLAKDLEAPIDFVGHVDPTELLEACWALVLFSAHEALNFAVQEAMWTGRPVVTTPLPGIRWLAGDTARYASGVGEAVAALDELCEAGTARARGQLAAARIRDVLDPDDPWPTVEAAYAGVPLRRR